MNKRTRQLIIASLLVLCPALCAAQSNTQNYILNRTFTSADGNTSQERVTYYNGLGRPVQTTDIGITPTRKDLVFLQEYDSRGKESFSWLPVQSSDDGAYINASTLKSDAIQQYENDSRPYTQMLYEASPLGRLVTLYGSGEAWTSNPVNYRYRFLSAQSIVPSTMQRPSGFYPVTQTTDEDGRVSYSFTDGMGHTILSGQVDGNESQLAYYVYNNRDELTYVHTPLTSYVFTYDPLHHRIYESHTNRDAVYSIFEKGGHPIFSQDGERREQDEWSFSFPDCFGRVMLTGICKHDYSYGTYPLLHTSVQAERTDAVNSLYGHTVSGVTLNNVTLHGVNFYDDYAFIGKNGVPTSLNYATPPSGYGTRYTGGYKGLLTGTVTARLDASGVAGYDYTAYYYDDRGRVIQTRSTNHLGGTDVEYVAYNFVGDPVKRQHVHTASGKATQTETYTYTYDHAGRLTVTKYRLNSNAEITLASNTYDELGRLQTKSLHGSTANKQTYSYNIRDWLTGISGSKFTQNLYYNTGSGTPQYGGNISSMTWKAGNESTVRGYKFAYDGLSRLTSATYGEGTSISSNANRFTEKVTGYDLNGNIKGLQRYGQTSSSAYGLIDDLTYTLSGNKLTRVDDAVNTSAYNNGFEFKDAVQQADEYAYDKTIIIRLAGV